MPRPRDLEWPDCLNVRDLGGLRASDGGTTRFGAVVRGDHPSYLTDAGWAALWDHGVRTVISLETDTRDPRVAAGNNLPLVMNGRYSALTHLRLRIEDGDDADFMSRWADTGLWATPLYYADALARWPARFAALVRHIAHSPPGGVLIHCGRGCDRTGLATFVLLGLAGVVPEEIAADYARSAARLAAREPGFEAELAKILDAHETTVEDTIEALLEQPVEEYLLDAGASSEDLASVRHRLLATA